MVRVFNPGTRRSNGKEKREWRSLARYAGVTTKIKDRVGTYDPRWPKVAYKLQSSADRGKYTKSPSSRSGNPPKRKLSLAQKLHFGTKRQRAAAGLMLSRVGKRKRVSVRTSNSATIPKWREKSYRGNRKARRAEKTSGIGTKLKYYMKKRQTRFEARMDKNRIGNPGEIITLAGLAGNPGRLRKRKVGNVMAKRRTRKMSGIRRRARAARRRAHNPNVMVRYSRRRRNSMRRRSNPGFLSGGVGMLVGIFGGAALTGAIAARIPGQLSSGIAGYLTTGVVAYAQGTLAGKLLKNPTLGKNMVTGGLIYLGLKIAGDLIPGLSLPFGLSGLGAIGSSNFSYPQIPASNTMLYASPTPVMAAAKGMGRAARMGRGY